MEALKPPNVPGMRERYKLAVAKERRLEAVTHPPLKADDKKVCGYDDDNSGDDDVVSTFATILSTHVLRIVAKVLTTK